MVRASVDSCSLPKAIKDELNKINNKIYDHIKEKLKKKTTKIAKDLASLQSALEDYRGQYVELTMMSITVTQLMDYYEDADFTYSVDEHKFENDGAKGEEIFDASSVIDQSRSKTGAANGFAENSNATLAESDMDNHAKVVVLKDDDLANDNSLSMIDKVETALAEFDFLEQVENGVNSESTALKIGRDEAISESTVSSSSDGSIKHAQEITSSTKTNSLHPSSSVRIRMLYLGVLNDTHTVLICRDLI